MKKVGKWVYEGLDSGLLYEKLGNKFYGTETAKPVRNIREYQKLKKDYRIRQKEIQRLRRLR